MKALLIEAGSSLVYFTSVQWWRSERLTAGLIPAEGQPIIITPEFEEPSVRENLKVPAEVRVWNEHQSPFALLADWSVTDPETRLLRVSRFCNAAPLSIRASADSKFGGSSSACCCQLG